MDNKINNDDTTTTSTYNRILKAAERIFAEKGYDAASVSEIANMANISKTQIFYYFKSKKDLLNELFKNHINSCIKYRFELWERVDSSSKEDVGNFIVAFMHKIEAEKDIMRIGLLEAFKNSSESIALFELLNPILKSIFLQFKNKDINVINDDNIEFTMKIFFFVMVPIYTYYNLSQKFASFYKIDKSKANVIFYDLCKNLFTNEILKK